MQPSVNVAGRWPRVSQTTSAVSGVWMAMMIEACSGRVMLRPTQTKLLKPAKPIRPKTMAGASRGP